MEAQNEETLTQSARRRGRPPKSSEDSMREWHVGVRLTAREWETITERYGKAKSTLQLWQAEAMAALLARLRRP